MTDGQGTVETAVLQNGPKRVKPDGAVSVVAAAAEVALFGVTRAHFDEVTVVAKCYLKG